jgi:general secretion pathway protein D
MSPSNAVTLINAMKLSVTPPISEGKSLIVTTYSNRIPRLERILEMIDKPGEPRKFRYRQLRYTMAQTLVPKLQTLAEQLGTVNITISAEEEEAPSPSPRRSSETAAQYAARLRREQQLRAQRAAAAARTGGAAEEQVQPSVFLDADERTNRILMIGDKEQLDAVEDLIDTLDVAQQDLRSLKLYKIENVDAEEVRDKLIEFGIIGASTQTQGASGAEEVGGETAPAVQQRTPARRRTSARTGTEEQEQEALVEEPQVVVIEQTNSLLVNATEEQQKRIETIKDYVDSQVVQDEIPYKVYQLRNQGPEHLREILLPLVEETITTATGGDEQAKIQETRKKQEEPITIVADPNTFSLVVYANKKNQDWIESLVKQLDKRRPQVLIDVTLVQISKTDSFEYDLNLLESFPDLTSTSGLTSAIMDIAAGANDEFDGDINHGVNLVPRLNGGRDHFLDFQSDNGRGTAFYGDKHINFLLKAMRQKDYGRVLAKPKILVNDNEEGVIKTIDRTYVTKQTGTIIEGVTNAVQTAVDYQDYPAGITLTIVPHISESDLLRLDINLERSDFGTITGEKPPDTTESNVVTTVTVPDGSTIILGGMIKLNQSKGGTKVPLLGDIPLLGGLFRSTSNSDIQRNLYVFVKAEIIRPPDDGYASNDLQQISDRTKNAFEKHELEFQKYQDWPGVKPQPMEPLKVLEAQ